jgi:hypothetical protein
MKQIGCKHEDKWCWTFKLKEEVIDFCDECCKMLFLEMLNHAKEMKEVKELLKERGWR